MGRTGLLAFALSTLLALPAGAYVGYDDATDPLYAFSDTLHPADPDVPAYDFRSIASTGTPVTLSGGVMGPYPIGFPFEFYEEVYTEVRMSTYGVLMFESGTPSSYPSPIPTAGSPDGFVAGAWTYYDTWSGGTGYYLTRGAAPNRELVAEWNGMYPDGWTPATFQVVLEEATGNIVVHVQTLTSSWSTVAVGIESQDGRRGISAYYATGTLTSYACVFSSFGERPIVRVVSGELSVPEGGSMTLEVDVRDRQDDLEGVSWDLDGDGEFDDASGTSVLVSAEGMDGPDTIEATVRAADRAGNVRIVPIQIAVSNVPPAVLNEPVTEVLRGEEWEYMLEISDPGGDVVRVTAPERPDGMTVLGTGGVRWTPTDDDVGEHPIRLVVADDDDDPEVVGDGEVVLEFTLEVLRNTAPGAPAIIEPRMNEVLDTLRPTFRVRTPEDPEDDPLFLTFDIDRVDTFDSPRLVTSGQMSATRGETGWTASQDLEDGASYWWRVYAWDGHDRGPAARGRFTIDLGGDPDGGADGGDDGGPDPIGTDQGCRCRAGGEGPAAAAPVALLLLALALLRRRPR